MEFYFLKKVLKKDGKIHVYFPEMQSIFPVENHHNTIILPVKKLTPREAKGKGTLILEKDLIHSMSLSQRIAMARAA